MRIAKIIITAAAGAVCALAQEAAPAGFAGREADPNHCAAPTGMAVANYKSTEQLPDGRVIFRICAPNAATVSLGSSDNEDISPNTFMGGTGRPMAKDEKGL